MDWDWDFALSVLPELLAGLWVTIQATVLGTALAMSLGLVLALMRRAPGRLVNLPARGFIEFVRSTPLLVQLYFVFFVFPIWFGLSLSPLTTGILVLGLHYSTYISEVYRAGIESVPRGQWEAATALNLSQVRTWRSVILPQAIPPILPALGNYVISLLKDTPQLLAIAVLELLGAAQEIGAQQFRFVEVFTIAGLMFFVLSYVSSLLVRRVEARYGSVEQVV